MGSPGYPSADGKDTSVSHASTAAGSDLIASFHNFYNTLQERLPPLSALTSRSGDVEWGEISRPNRGETSTANQPSRLPETAECHIERSREGNRSRTRQHSLNDLLQGGRPGSGTEPETPKHKRPASDTPEDAYDGANGSPTKRLRTADDAQQRPVEWEGTHFASSLLPTQLGETVTSLLQAPYTATPTRATDNRPLYSIDPFRPRPPVHSTSTDTRGAEGTATYAAPSCPNVLSAEAVDTTVNMEPRAGDRSILLPSVASFGRIANTSRAASPPPSAEAGTQASAAPSHDRQTDTAESASNVSGPRSPASGRGTNAQEESENRPAQTQTTEYHRHTLPLSTPQFTDPWPSDADGEYHHHKLPTTGQPKEDGESKARRWHSTDTPAFGLPKLSSFEHIPRPEPLARRSRCSSDTPLQHIINAIGSGQYDIDVPRGPLPPIKATREPYGAPKQTNIILPPLLMVPPPAKQAQSQAQSQTQSQPQLQPKPPPPPGSSKPRKPARKPREVTTPLLPDQTAGHWIPVADSRYGGTTFDLDAPPLASAAAKTGAAEKKKD